MLFLFLCIALILRIPITSLARVSTTDSSSKKKPFYSS
jgi:hypothetical protein